MHCTIGSQETKALSFRYGQCESFDGHFPGPQGQSVQMMRVDLTVCVRIHGA